MAEKVAVFTIPTARRLTDIANATPVGTPRAVLPYRQTSSSRVLVKLTVVITGGNLRVWEAIEVFLDADGLATDVTGGLTFDSDDPIYTVADAAADDVLMCERESRETGLYWIGGAAGSGGGGAAATVIFGINKTDSETGAGDWAILNATNVGTFADVAALLAAEPTPSIEEYAFVTSTGTFWEATTGDWVDSGSSDEDVIPNVSGTWAARSDGVNLSLVKCKADQLLILTRAPDGEYRADLNFARRRWVT